MNRTEEESGIPDLAEKGRDLHGNVISLDRRLFMQLQVFTAAPSEEPLIAALESAIFPATFYIDVCDPGGVGLLTWSEHPDFFATTLRAFIRSSPFSGLEPRKELTMFGRTYAVGYESNLEHVLFDRPIERATNPDWPWHIWYPLRRKRIFEQLPPYEQRAILNEHGALGARFSAGDLGHDIRLDCRGLNFDDNDFVIGLVGKELFPLSAMVQAMRKTRQTSEFIERLGPFFVGRAIWRRRIGSTAKVAGT